MKKSAVIICSLVLGLVIAAGTFFTFATPARTTESTLAATTQATAAAPTASSQEEATRASSEYISADKAQSVALKDAGVSRGDVTFRKTKLERDDGTNRFEVEFYVGRTEYEYTIDAKTGKILDKEIDTDEEPTVVKATAPVTTEPSATKAPAVTEPATSAPQNTTKPAPSYISAAKAKYIALSDAGLSSLEATFTKAELDRDDGRAEYEIEFHVGNTEYEYSIDALTGAILGKDIDKNKPATKKPSATNQSVTKPAETTTKKSSTSDFISISKAKSIALDHSGLNANKVSFRKVQLEKDDGVYEYEVEFHVGNMEYEYSIDAKTGRILDFDKDLDD